MTSAIARIGRPMPCSPIIGIIGRGGTSHPVRQKRNGRSPRPRGDGRFSKARVGPATTPVQIPTPYSIRKGQVCRGTI